MDSNIEDYLHAGVDQKASDLHISPGSPPILRINSELIEIKDAPVLDGKMTEKMILSLMDDAQQKQFASSLELDFAIDLPTYRASFRANAFHQIDGSSAVFRVIPRDIPTLEELNAPPILKTLVQLPNGLILITGPTGSGKSTTLAAMINYVNLQQAKHIITIEDPIEFKHQRKKCIISQRQIPRDSSSFSSALRSALREDPNIILVGEMRDLETIRLALTAAETGHLVLATLHTSSAPRAISRIVDVFPAREKNIIKSMISESIQAVICQTLLKKISGGRIAAYEIMLGTPAIRNQIRENKIAQMYSTMQTGTSIGMITMQQAIQDLIKKGLVAANVLKKEDKAGDFQKELFEKM